MKKRDYTVVLEQDEDGVFVGSVPTILGCYTQGDSIDELIGNLKEVITLCVRNSEPQQSMRFVGVQSIEVA